jgi:hypothetical protein
VQTSAKYFKKLSPWKLQLDHESAIWVLQIYCIKNLQTSANFYDLRIFDALGVASFSFIQQMNSLLFMCCKLVGILLYCKQ